MCLPAGGRASQSRRRCGRARATEAIAAPPVSGSLSQHLCDRARPRPAARARARARIRRRRRRRRRRPVRRRACLRPCRGRADRCPIPARTTTAPSPLDTAQTRRTTRTCTQRARAAWRCGVQHWSRRRRRASSTCCGRRRSCGGGSRCSAGRASPVSTQCVCTYARMHMHARCVRACSVHTCAVELCACGLACLGTDHRALAHVRARVLGRARVRCLAQDRFWSGVAGGAASSPSSRTAAGGGGGAPRPGQRPDVRADGLEPLSRLFLSRSRYDLAAPCPDGPSP